MIDTELHWLAGLLEGEGSFVSGPPSKPNSPRIALEMTDRDIVERIAVHFGTTYIHSRPAKGNWQKCFRITCKGSRAVDLMRKLYPLMGARRKQQIERALDGYVESTRRATKRTCRRNKLQNAGSHLWHPRSTLFYYLSKEAKRTSYALPL